MSRRKQRSTFDQVSEFDRGRIVAYRGCGLSFREIGSRVGRNQTTVMRICDRWMQEGTTDRRGRSHPPQSTTSHEDRQIVRMAVTDRSVTSRTVAQLIDSITHHSVSARTIRRHLLQSGLSARCPLLGLPLTQNHRRLHHQWCNERSIWAAECNGVVTSTLGATCDERRMWAAQWNEVAFTDESCICLQHHYGRIRVWRHRGERILNSCVMHRHTGPAPAIMLWGGIGYHSRTLLARIASTLNSQRYISEIENMWSMVAQQSTQITPLAATPDPLWQRVKAAWSTEPQEHIQSLFESMPKRVSVVISNNGGYSGY
ncbi:transposable element Tcb1 transposase [Trichonephila clavipes]|nr:transposable element Tcb1 transposase [Trichonephila clavipes]